jgi:hypothetical protein
MLEQGAKDAAAARFASHIDALNPPKPAVPPIAPFCGDHDLAQDSAVLLGKEIDRFAGIRQSRRHAGGKKTWVELLVLAFLGQPTIELDDCWSIGRSRQADGKRHDCLLLKDYSPQGTKGTKIRGQ